MYRRYKLLCLPQLPHRDSYPKLHYLPYPFKAWRNNRHSAHGCLHAFVDITTQASSQYRMASMTPRGQDVVDHVPNEVTDIPNTHLEPPLPIHSTPVSSTPLEMSRLEPRPRSPSPEKPRDMAVEAEVQNSQSESMNPAPSSSVLSALGPATSSAHEPPTLSSTDNARPTSPTGVPLTAQATNPAIGPSSDQPTPMPKETDLIGPTLVLTLLLPTGARHPYRMDEKYLKKRNVHVANNNPIHMSVYTLKELIWREWREGTDTYILRSHGWARVR